MFEEGEKRINVKTILAVSRSACWVLSGSFIIPCVPHIMRLLMCNSVKTACLTDAGVMSACIS